MATIKVACPRCGQKVSGDESFHGTVVECPVCSSDILFPGQKRVAMTPENLPPVPSSGGVSGAAGLDTHPDAVIRSGREEDSFRELSREESGGEVDRAVSRPDRSDRSEGGATGEGEERMLPPSPIFGAISIVSAVLGVVTCVGGILFAPLAIIFGHTALARARHSPVQPAPGHTLGAIGLMIGYVNLVLLILVLLAMTFFGEVLKEALAPLRQSLAPR